MFTRRALTSMAKAAPLGARAFSASAPARTATMVVVGRLTAEPELYSTNGGKELVRYSIASAYGPSDNRQVSYFRLASFDEGDRRNHLLSLPKGALVSVVADARMGSYTAEDGSSRSALNLVQQKLSVLSRPRPVEEGSEPAAAAGGAA